MRNIISLCAFILSISCIAQNNSSSSNNIKDSNTGWHYSQNIDAMTSDTDYFAWIHPDNDITLMYPEQKNATVLFEVINDGGASAVILQISEGEFLLDNSKKCSVRMRFDQGKPVVYNFSPPNDGRTNLVTVENDTANLITDQLKKIKSLKMEFTIKMNGGYTLAFNTSGLRWNHVGLTRKQLKGRHK